MELILILLQVNEDPEELLVTSNRPSESESFQSEIQSEQVVSGSTGK